MSRLPLLPDDQLDAEQLELKEHFVATVGKHNAKPAESGSGSFFPFLAANPTIGR